MYCSKCGAAMADDARFCTSCGSALPSNTNAPTQDNAPTVADAAAASTAPMAEQNAQVAAQTAPIAAAQTTSGETAQTSPSKNRTLIIGGIVAAAIIAILAIALGISLASGNGTAKNSDGSSIYAFGSETAVAVSPDTLIVPGETSSSPYEHYYVRIREGANTSGLALDVFDYPHLEVKTSEGFSLADFASGSSSLPNGTYTLCVTDDSGVDHVLPPLELSSGTSSATQTSVIVASEDTSGNSEADNTGSQKQGRYAAYLAAIRNLEASYGSASVTSRAYGVCFAQLVDFGDGIERLVVAYDAAGGTSQGSGSYQVDVYEYDKGSDTATLVTSSSSSAASDGSAWLTFSTGSDGNTYLYIQRSPRTEPAGVAVALSYYGVKDDGSFGECVALETVTSGRLTTYYINGQVADENTYFAENEKRYMDYRNDDYKGVIYCFDSGSSLSYDYGPSDCASECTALISDMTHAAASASASDTFTSVVASSSSAS